MTLQGGLNKYQPLDHPSTISPAFPHRDHQHHHIYASATNLVDVQHLKQRLPTTHQHRRRTLLFLNSTSRRALTLQCASPAEFGSHITNFFQSTQLLALPTVHSYRHSLLCLCEVDDSTVHAGFPTNHDLIHLTEEMRKALKTMAVYTDDSKLERTVDAGVVVYR